VLARRRVFVDNMEGGIAPQDRGSRIVVGASGEVVDAEQAR
jgi:hypothetical protein